VALAKPGLTRAQVRDVLGSPLLADPFHADRWDYVFTIRRQGAEPQLRRIIVRFKADVLEAVEGATGLPSELEFITSIDTFKTARNAPQLVLTDEQIKTLPVPVRPSPPEPPPPVPARTYPPLEPSS
jgi:outer membrane protein assembly factor BamE